MEQVFYTFGVIVLAPIVFMMVLWIILALTRSGLLEALFWLAVIGGIIVMSAYT